MLIKPPRYIFTGYTLNYNFTARACCEAAGSRRTSHCSLSSRTAAYRCPGNSSRPGRAEFWLAEILQPQDRRARNLLSRPLRVDLGNSLLGCRWERKLLDWKRLTGMRLVNWRLLGPFAQLLGSCERTVADLFYRNFHVCGEIAVL